MSRRSLLSALAILTLSVFVLVPAFLVVAAGHVVRSEPCVADGHVGTSSAEPGDAFFRALRLLEISASFPGFTGTAARTSATAVTLCTRSLHQGCSKLRDAAMEEALLALRDDGYPMSHLEGELDWWLPHLNGREADLCADWSPWMSWLESRAVDPLDLCPVCQPLPETIGRAPYPAVDGGSRRSAEHLSDEEPQETDELIAPESVAADGRSPDAASEAEQACADAADAEGDGSC